MTKFWAVCFAIAAISSHFLSEKMYHKAQVVMDMLRDRGTSDDLTILNATIASYRATDIGTVFEYAALGFACMSAVGIIFIAAEFLIDYLKNNRKDSSVFDTTKNCLSKH